MQTIILDGLEITIGDEDCDLTEADLSALVRQHEAQARKMGGEVRWPLSGAHVATLVAVMRVFRGSRVVRTER